MAREFLMHTVCEQIQQETDPEFPERLNLTELYRSEKS